MSANVRISRSVPAVLLAKGEAAEALGIGLSHFGRQFVQDHVPVIYSSSRLVWVDGLERWANARGGSPWGANWRTSRPIAPGWLDTWQDDEAKQR